ncbi:hypothetical protein [uncultured Dubosiella sp.]|uniref:hypothetical protein n=1 Tax=uncultured Dubosiella sp. TaxID=1937011 RepID=UPI002615778A|nr:hypothetical protein [uncultured Dubosiella sp.]
MKAGKILGALVLCLGMLTAPVLAEETENTPYTYTVRIYRGNHGHFKSDPGAEYIEYEVGYNEPIPSLNVNDLVEIDQDVAKPYYPSGIKESGKDLLTASSYLGNTSADEDKDYIISYGLLLDPVEYTINYLDVNGNVLSEPSRYTGNVGDQIVLSYPYFEGYVPQANNARFTLTQDGTNNFNFYYEEGEGPTVIPGTTTTVTDTETETVTTTPGTTTPGADTTTPGGDDATTPGGEDTTPNEPQDVIDIEDDNVPLAGPDENEPTDNADAGMSLPAKIGLGAVLVLLVAGIIYFLVKKKKDTDKE